MLGNKKGKVEIIIGVIIVILVIGGITYSTMKQNAEKERIREAREAARQAALEAEKKRKEEKQQKKEEPSSEEVSEDTAPRPETGNMPGNLDVTPTAGFTGVQKQPAATSTGGKPSAGSTAASEKTADADSWELVFHDDFSSSESLKNWEFQGGTWTIEKGELVGKAEQTHLAIYKKDIAGDVRIEFTVHIDSVFLNDVSCFINAKYTDPPINTAKSGYLLQYGGYTNSRNVITRDGYIVKEVYAPPIKKGQTYHMIGERKNGVIRFIVDGKEIAKLEDEDPLSGSEYSKLGLYAWGGDNYYGYVKIFVPKKKK